MSDLARKNRYYREQSEFRARVLANVKARHERDKSDPEYRRLVRLRKRIYETREQIALWLDKVRRAERRLLTMIQDRDKLAELRRGRKARA